jgi:glucose/arabinose dehydrogenase
MFQRLCIFTFALSALSGAIAGRAHAQAPKEADYYQIQTYAIPKGEVLEAGSLEMMPDGRLAFGTRRGEIWMIENPLGKDGVKDAKFSLYAQGLHEILGLAQRDGWLYVTHRPDVTRIKDSKGRGKADVFEVVADPWEISGDYHEYAFGSKFDKNGNMYVTLCLTGSFTSNVKFRGWCLQISADGKVTPWCSGLRSPGGVAFNAAGDLCYTDNQGPWNGSCSLKFLEKGKFMGHPAGNKWYSFAPELGPRPVEPKSKSRWDIEMKKIPELTPPAVWFPYPKMGQSASGIAFDSSGNFGPFKDQLFVGDQTHSTVMRVYLEKIKGHYQGACFPFRQGFSSGNLGLLMAPDGSLLVAGTNRGWGSRGNKPFALERLVWTGKVPFEIHEMHLQPDGFELTFLEPVDAKTAADPKSYKMQTYTYIYQSDYGSPEVDATNPTITKTEVAPDGKSVRLYVSKLMEGHVHELALDGLRSATGLPLLHKQAYYTLNYFK